MTIAGERPIALVGLMGAGKSEVARSLGARLGVAVADLDAMVEARAGRCIAEIFARDGESAFRRLEAEALGEALAGGVGVLACGGGIVLDPRLRGTLGGRCRVAWLQVRPETAAARLAGAAGTRPLLAGLAAADAAAVAERLAKLLEQRRAFYEEVAVVRVEVDGRAPDAVADELLRLLEAGR